MNLHTKLNFSFGKRPSKRKMARKPLTLIYPEREWFIGLCIASAIFVCGSAYAGLLFFRELNATGAHSEMLEKRSAYQHALVRSTLKAYQERASSFEAKRREKQTSKVSDVLLIEDAVVNATSTASSSAVESTPGI